MKSISKKDIIFALVFLVAIALRTSLALVNTKSNDDHYEVSRIIMEEGRIPIGDDCRECYQPKFFHFAVATLITILNIPTEQHIIFIQLLNVMASIYILYFFYIFIKDFKINIILNLSIFSLLAFIPGLLSINIQPTNDTFVILFSVAAFYFLFLYWKDGGTKNFSMMTLFAIFSGITKVNGLFVGFIIIVSLFLKIILFWKQSRVKYVLVANFFVFFFIFSLPVSFFGQYLENYIRYGTPLYVNVKSPRTGLVVNGIFPNRPGYTNIIETFMTFKFTNLFFHPLLFQKGSNITNSLWTTLYSAHNFSHSSPWPPKWESYNSFFVFWLARAIYIFALFPFVIFVYGLLSSFLLIIKKMVRPDIIFFKNNFQWIVVFAVILYLIFIMLYTYIYIDFSVMKPIFIYPGFLVFIKVFYDGMKKLSNLLNEKIISIFIILLSFLYAVDALFLFLEEAKIL